MFRNLGWSGILGSVVGSRTLRALLAAVLIGAPVLLTASPAAAAGGLAIASDTTAEERDQVLAQTSLATQDTDDAYDIGSERMTVVGGVLGGLVLLFAGVALLRRRNKKRRAASESPVDPREVPLVPPVVTTVISTDVLPHGDQSIGAESEE